VKSTALVGQGQRITEKVRHHLRQEKETEEDPAVPEDHHLGGAPEVLPKERGPAVPDAHLLAGGQEVLIDALRQGKQERTIVDAVPRLPNVTRDRVPVRPLYVNQLSQQDQRIAQHLTLLSAIMSAV